MNFKTLRCVLRKVQISYNVLKAESTFNLLKVAIKLRANKSKQGGDDAVKILHGWFRFIVSQILVCSTGNLDLKNTLVRNTFEPIC